MASHKSTALFLSAMAVMITGPIAAHEGNSDLPSSSASRYDPAKEYQLGLDALNKNDFKAADTAFGHVLQVAPKEPSALVLSGMAKNGLNDFKGARDAYKKALSADPNMLLAQRGYALSLVSTGDKDGAAKALDVLKKHAETCGACADAADLKAAVAEVEAAIAAPGKQSSIAPSALLMAAVSGDHAYMTAVSAINEKRYDAALTSLKQAQTAFGPHPDVLTYIGFTYRKLGKYDLAETYYRQALAVAPNHLGATEYYGELKVERGDIKGAKALLAKLDNICSFGCIEAEELRRWIAQGHG